MVDAITCALCNIWRLSVKGCGCGEGSNLPSPIDLKHRPYNIGHTIPVMMLGFMQLLPLDPVVDFYLPYNAVGAVPLKK